MKDLKVFLKDRPGSLADLGEVLGKFNVNIQGGCGFPCDNKGVIHLLFEDAGNARKVLEDAGFEIQDEREVLVMVLDNQPGELGRVSRKLANSSININLVYVASDNRLVLGVDDIEKARSVLA